MILRPVFLRTIIRTVRHRIVRPGFLRSMGLGFIWIAMEAHLFNMTMIRKTMLTSRSNLVEPNMNFGGAPNDINNRLVKGIMIAHTLYESFHIAYVISLLTDMLFLTKNTNWNNLVNCPAHRIPLGWNYVEIGTPESSCQI